ncbi:MAG TPA: type II toxin-antitoxin system HicB family antitoxin [Polyangiaceae bacterium]|jgi:predicted RNase H-like HicB family nuclease
MKYLVVVEESASGFSAYSPDVPGCIATGESRSDVERRIAQAIAFHIEGMRTEGLSIPEPHSFSAYVEVPA